MTRQLVQAVAKAKAGIRLTALERAILERNIEAAIDAVGLERIRNALAGVQETVVRMREAGWHQATEGLPARIVQQAVVRLGYAAYTVDRPDVMLAVQTADLRRIREIDAETRAALRQELARGIREGIHPTEVARRIRETIGLNRRQAAVVSAFRQRLFAEGRDRGQVERMTLRFANRQMQLRAQNIAQTEIMTALNTGRRLQVERLTREGVIQGPDWEQEWVTADDERTCPICLPLNGQRIPIGGTFVTGAGNLQQPPAHPRCRCLARLVPVGFRKGDHPSPARRRILESIGVASSGV